MKKSKMRFLSVLPLLLAVACTSSGVHEKRVPAGASVGDGGNSFGTQVDFDQAYDQLSAQFKKEGLSPLPKESICNYLACIDFVKKALDVYAFALAKHLDEQIIRVMADRLSKTAITSQSPIFLNGVEVKSALFNNALLVDFDLMNELQHQQSGNIYPFVFHSYVPEFDDHYKHAQLFWTVPTK